MSTDGRRGQKRKKPALAKRFETHPQERGSTDSQTDATPRRSMSSVPSTGQTLQSGKLDFCISKLIDLQSHAAHQ